MQIHICFKYYIHQIQVTLKHKNMFESTDKYYQTQLLKLSSENSHLKSEILQIKVHHEETIKQLSQTQLGLAQAQHKLQVMTKQNQITNQNYQLFKAKYGQSQNSYKSLFDYTFVDGGHLQQGQCSHCQQIERNSVQSEIDLINSLNQINYDFQKQRVAQLQQMLERSNQSIKQLYQQNSRLRVNIISLTSDYHKSLAQMNNRKFQVQSELNILKQNIHSVTEKLQNKVSGKSEQFQVLQAEINNLKAENYNLLLEIQVEREKAKLANRFNINNSFNTNLNNLLTDNSPQKVKAGSGILDSSHEINLLTPNFGAKNAVKTQGIQEITNLMHENEQLESENKKLRASLDIIHEFSPYLFQNISEIENFAKKYEQFRNFEQRNLELVEKLCETQQQLRCLGEQLDKTRKSNQQLTMSKWQKYQKSLLYIRKLKEVIRRIDPFFKMYGYNTTDVFTEEQLRFLECGFEIDIQTQLYLQSRIIKTQQQRDKAKDELKIANKKIQRSIQTIKQLQKDCIRNKAIVESEVLNLLQQNNYQHNNYYSQIYETAFTQLQLQRETLSKSLIQQQTQLTKIKAERDFYKLNRVQQTIVVTQTPSLKMYQLRPIILHFGAQQNNIVEIQSQMSDLRTKIQLCAKKISNDLSMVVRQNFASILRQRQRIQGLMSENRELVQAVDELSKRIRSQKADKQLEMRMDEQIQDQNHQTTQFHIHQIHRSEANQFSIHAPQSSQLLPLNTVSQESMGLLKKLLENYENLLKQKFADFENLKNNYQQVREKLALMESAVSANLEDSLTERDYQLKNSMIQLAQAKQNVNELEKHLQQATQETRQIQELLQKQRYSHQAVLNEKNTEIEQLKENLQQIKGELEQSMKGMQDSMMNQQNRGIKLSINDPAVSSMMVMISSKKDEISQFKKVILNKNNKIRELEDQIQRLQRRQVMGMHEKSPLERQEYMQVVRMLQDGRMASVMGQVIEFLRKIKQNSEGHSRV